MNKSDRDENRRYAFDKFISTIICESIVNTKSLEEQTIVDTNSLEEQMEDDDFCL